MTKQSHRASASDERVRILLARYKCPAPFHVVRTRFLGAIASPALSASPIKSVEDLWDGALPPFDSLDAANELIGELLMGLWNRMTAHLDPKSPLRLMRVASTPTRTGLASLALIRQQEIDGFVTGLCGRAEAIDLPDRAHRGLSALTEMRALSTAVLDIAGDGFKDVTDPEMATTLRHLRELTKIAEREMHAIMLSCKRARMHVLPGLPAGGANSH